jgi:hypothetical protein
MVQDYLYLNGKDFFASVHQYLKSKEYGNADSTDLWNSMSSPGLDITKIIAAWIYRPGYPVVSVQLISDQKIELSQRRCFDSPANSSGILEDEHWSIPFTYQVYTNATGVPLPLGIQQSLLMEASKYSQPLRLKMQGHKKSHSKDPALQVHYFIKPNVGQTGYYRFQLSNEMMQTASSWLEQYPETFSDLDRAGMLEDSLDSLMRSDISPNDSPLVLNMMQFLEKETSYPVWAVAVDHLNNLVRYSALNSEFPILKQKFHRLMEKAILALGWKETSTNRMDWHVRALLRAELFSFASRIDHPPTVNQARQWFKKWIMASHMQENEVPTMLRPVIADSGVRFGGDDEYLAVEGLLSKTILATDVVLYLHALAQARAPHLIMRNLEMVAQGVIRAQDRTRFLTWVLDSSPVAPPLVWSFVQSNWPRMVDRLAAGGAFASISEFIETLASRSYWSDDAMDSIKQFFMHSERQKLPGVLQALHRGISQAVATREWKNKYSKSLIAWAKPQLR